MARRCDYCNRGPHKMNSRSKSNIATKRWQHINLQHKTIAGKKYKICTKCLKTINKLGLAEIPLPGQIKFVHTVKN
jgi:ribosomal protein L28